MTWSRPRTRRKAPLALVMGDTDLLRPLARAGIECAVVGPPDGYAAVSRHTRALIPSRDPLHEGDELERRLLEFADTQPTRPVVFYQSDREALFVSRRRGSLGARFRLILPDSELMEDLLDKERFAQLASRLELPVPRSALLGAGAEAALQSGLQFPVVVKPLTRDPARWEALAGGAKALVAHTEDELADLSRRMEAAGGDPDHWLMAQELVPGPESRVESYHAYVDSQGRVAAEFTGRKIRTLPRDQGHSTALCTADLPDVAEAGRDALARTGFHGVAKADFKRGPDGRLWLLEINPRFSLWHNLGAAAGVNVPAVFYADGAGLPRPAVGAARPGVRWCELSNDRRAAAADGISFARWLAWAVRCEAKQGVSLDDPMVLVRRLLVPFVSRRVKRAMRPGRGAS